MKEMITSFKRNAAILLAWSLQTAAMASVADSFTIPQPDAGSSAICGAQVPYTRYDCNNSGEATLAGGASIKTSANWAKNNIASQASKQAYVELPSGASVEWTMNTYADGITARFTLADNSSGTGINGAFDVYVDGQFDQTVNIISYFMWQYFDIGQPKDTPATTGCFAFDETHFRLHKMLQPGSRIKIVSKGSTGFGIDFIETEVVPEPYDPSVNDAGRQVFNVTDYGASTSNADNVGAFNRAVAAATAVGGVVFIPEGTWKLGSMWSITSHDVKITGAGIWYTNLKFTSDQAFGGGISGGNKSNTGSSVMNNMEICNFYMNSNLRSRYGENAVYKGFMDVYREGSVIHDVWEEHFECGFWFGDYNDSATNPTSDGVKVVNCRIRNNLADGVNFCQGTSNATVYNCSVRNNGDDGLACWNNNYQSKKDETGNVFAYNTIDFVWRAGGIAIYGGNDFKIYNNYICDMFMASGIHLNTTFDGYKFNNTQSITFENNVLVRCGTNSDCWGEDLAAIDLKGNVKNVTFKNTRIYDSPFHAVRFLNGPENILFDGLLISGSGLARAYDEYSCVKHSCCAGRLQEGGVAIRNLKVAEESITPDLIGNNTTWPFWTDNNASMVPAYTKVETEEAPPYPDAVGIIPQPSLWDTLTDYDVELSGLCWQTQRGTRCMEEDDQVSFSVRIDNLSNTDIPANAKVVVKVTVDGKSSFTTTYTDGLPAHQSRIVTFTGTWKASPGAHTFRAELDPNGLMTNETNKTNNNRTKNINVTKAENQDPDLPTVSGGYDVIVTKITYGQDAISVGDQLYFTATVANIGDRDVPTGKKIGVQFQIDGKTWATGMITWCDSYSGGLSAGKTIDLKANGGGGQSNNNGPAYWTALEGEHTVMAWVNDDNTLTEEINTGNNQTEMVLSIPYGGIQYNENPDKADDLNNKGQYLDYENGGGTEPVEKDITAYKADGSQVTLKAESTLTVPSDIIAIDLSGKGLTAVMPNSNPNTLYILGNTDAVPEGLTGKNILFGTQATNISLTDGYDFFIPFTFTAENISYTRTPGKGTNGIGGWDTITLPFTVQSVWQGGQQMEWFKARSEQGKNFWLMGFTGMSDGKALFNYAQSIQANTPYIIAVPDGTWGDEWNLIGKPITFSATNATLTANSSMTTATDAFNFIGTLRENALTDVFALNEAGTSFEKGSTNIEAFRAYFRKNSNTSAPAALMVAIGELPTGIVLPMAPITKTVSVYNLNGMKIAQAAIVNGNVDLSNLPNGIYIVNGKKLMK